MELQLKIRADPIPFKAFENQSSLSRQKWNSLCEIISNFFCLSHGFNKDNTILVFVEDNSKNIIEIKIDGSSVRYVSPSLRSVASLICKTLTTAKQTAPLIWTETTPGIFVRMNNGDNQLDQHTKTVVEINQTNHVDFLFSLIWQMYGIISD